ncbi:hypothetical protein BS78_05G013500, partial [Paspalum vaginatum]
PPSRSATAPLACSPTLRRLPCTPRSGSPTLPPPMPVAISPPLPPMPPECATSPARLGAGSRHRRPRASRRLAAAASEASGTRRLGVGVRRRPRASRLLAAAVPTLWGAPPPPAPLQSGSPTPPPPHDSGACRLSTTRAADRATSPHAPLEREPPPARQSATRPRLGSEARVPINSPIVAFSNPGD